MPCLALCIARYETGGTPVLRDFADHVLAAVRIGNAHGALRVVAPLAVHDKEVVVVSWWQFLRGGPDPAAPFFHLNGSLLPIGKITDEQNALGVRFGEVEGLLLKSRCLSRHRSLTFPELVFLAFGKISLLEAACRRVLRAPSSLHAKLT